LILILTIISQWLGNHWDILLSGSSSDHTRLVAAA
jgi:hypothetical protein